MLSATLLAGLFGIGSTPATATCASLAGLTLPDTTITAVELFQGGTYTAPDGEVFPNLPAFCRVAATLTPTSDSDINVELWMPFSNWNGTFAGTGNGNIGGVIVYSSLPGGLQAGTAVANTDMGTSPPAGAGKRLTGHPEQQIDWATRSTHLMTVRSKEIIEAFYGEPPKSSYFVGCSTGGGQGIHEALQFPGDYDGIVAGAPYMNVTNIMAVREWDAQAFDGAANITMAQATAVTAGAVKRCAGKDGGLSSDNFLTDPRDCHWDPSALQCTGGSTDAPTCLTAAQVAAVRKFYQGPINPRTSKRIYAGQVRGSESNSGYPANNEALADQGFVHWALGNDFDWRTFDFDHDMDTIDQKLAATLNANTERTRMPVPQRRSPPYGGRCMAAPMRGYCRHWPRSARSTAFPRSCGAPRTRTIRSGSWASASVYKSYDPRAKVLRQHCSIPISIAAYCCFYVSLAMRVPNIQCTGAALTMLYRRRPCRRLCGDPSSASSGAFALL
jgi:feruloyl esterase